MAGNKVMKDKKGNLTGTISKAEKGKPDNMGTVSWKFMSMSKKPTEDFESEDNLFP